MNPYVLAAIARERRDILRAEYARGPLQLPAVRSGIARALRASGDRLFRLGVALDGRVSTSVTAETST